MGEVASSCHCSGPGWPGGPCPLPAAAGCRACDRARADRARADRARADRARGRQPGRDRRRHRQHHAIRLDDLARTVQSRTIQFRTMPGGIVRGGTVQGGTVRGGTVRGGTAHRRAIAAPAPGQPHPEPGPRPAGQHLDGGHLRAEPHLRAQPGQQRARRLPVQDTERDGRHPDVRGVAGPQQRGLHHGGGQREVGVIAVHVERGHREQVPQQPPCPLVLPVGGETVTQPLPVKFRLRRVQGRHGQGGPRHAQSLGAGEEAVAHEGLAHVQRAGQRGPAQPCPALPAPAR